MINGSALGIAILVGLFVMTSIAFIAARMYAAGTNNAAKKLLNDDDDWLFKDFGDKIYDVIYGDKDPVGVAGKLGIDCDKYFENCRVARVTPDIKKIIVYSLFGVFILMIGAIGMIFLKGNLSFIVFGICFFIAVYMYYYQQHKLDGKVERMKDEINDEIPRFIGLLYTELQIGMPIEDAIKTLCGKMNDSLLADEFKDAFTEAEMGYSGWQEALESLAFRYNIPMLNVFVQNIVTAYNEGVSITETVARISKEVNESHLLLVKERAGKATNTLLIPISIFQFVPMIVFLMYPALIQLASSGIGF